MPWRSRRARLTGPANAEVSAADRADVHERWPRWLSTRWTDGKFPLVLGGDHSVAVGTVAGVSQHFREASEKIGLIWIDAHADMNTPESSPSGNVHGMPLACCIGLGPRELTHIFGYAPKVDPRTWRWSAFATWIDSNATHVRESGVTPSPCATSTSAGCAP